jgi:hypothetical protein
MSIGVLLAYDAAPSLFRAEAHDVLAALPLALIALALIAYQAVRRATAMEWAKAILLAFAFLFWAANQLLPDRRVATLFNDAAIAAFVLDVFLAMLGRPRSAESKWTAKHAPHGSVGVPGNEQLTSATSERG